MTFPPNPGNPQGNNADWTQIAQAQNQNLNNYPMQSGYGYPPNGQLGYNPAANFSPNFPTNKSSKSKRNWIVAGIAVAIVAAIVGIVIVLNSGSSAQESAESVVKNYLQALADGDAKKAIKLGSASPPDENLMTSEILKKQQAKSKISEIKIVDTNTYSSGGTVQVRYKFGTQTLDEDIQVKKSGDTWKIEKTYHKIELKYIKNDAFGGLRFFGTAIPETETTAYVFPGPQEWDSTNVNISLKVKSKEFPTVGSLSSGYTEVESTMSDQGIQNIKTAILAYAANCATSRELRQETDVPGCNFSLYESEAIPRSVVWIAPTELKDFEISYLSDNGARFKFSWVWGVSFMTPHGKKSGTSTDDFVTGTADITKNPVTVDMS